jgi:hypothetical protein
MVLVAVVRLAQEDDRALRCTGDDVLSVEPLASRNLPGCDRHAAGMGANCGNRCNANYYQYKKVRNFPKHEKS